jgi:SAM-dependent methyltransferase
VLSPDAITACYRVLLGREPETEAVVQASTRLPSYEALLAGFLESEEHCQRFPQGGRRCYMQPARQVDVEVSQEDLEAMFERIRGEWSALGEEAPYWSVLTHEAYRGKTLSPADAEMFFASGADTIQILEAFAGRCGVELPAGRCLEFGAGVGRVTAHLARRFQDVVAVDISPGNLAICKAVLAEQNAKNVTPMLLRAPADVRSIPDFDILISTIVFQHNPPPGRSFDSSTSSRKACTGGGLC